jgi:hypothetical protein
VFGIVGLGIVGLVTAGLWNVLMPGIFGLPRHSGRRRHYSC